MASSESGVLSIHPSLAAADGPPFLAVGTWQRLFGWLVQASVPAGFGFAQALLRLEGAAVAVGDAAAITDAAAGTTAPLPSCPVGAGFVAL